MRNMPYTKPLLKGILSFVVRSLRTVHTYGNPLGTVSAESCYSIFLRHLSLVRGVGLPIPPRVIAELGPGSSLGVGLAALIAGTEKYYALDLVNFSNVEANLAVFDELTEMFRRKAPIPATGLHSRRFPDLDVYEYPSFLEFESDAAFDKRIALIRRDIADNTGKFLHIAAPWTETSVVVPGSVNWIISNSVLEHIDDLSDAYRALAQWLAPSGYMSHQIDFGSHRLTPQWNGHWGLSEPAWAALRGRRPYLINRQPYSEHVRLATENGFITVFEKRNKCFDGLIPEQFAPRFRAISDEDARARMVFVVSRFA